MATHDYEISNQTPANLRADLNNALQAIVTQNSGSSAPTTTFANMIWYDTANNQIKKRNEADTAWITLGTIDEGTGKFDPNNSYVNISYTPVQQGGGTGQGTNKVYIGWSGSQLALQVDSTDFGANWPINILGIGQTWQQVSRAAGTSYQNTTGRAIMFALYFRPETAYVQVSSNNSTWITIGNGGGGSGEWGSVSAIVPSGWYYRTTGGTIGAWGELR